MFVKLKSVTPLSDFVLHAVFQDGAERLYDVKPLIDKLQDYQDLKRIPLLYEHAYVDTSGSGVIWNDRIDVGAEMIYEEGIPV